MHCRKNAITIVCNQKEEDVVVENEFTFLHEFSHDTNHLLIAGCNLNEVQLQIVVNTVKDVEKFKRNLIH